MARRKSSAGVSDERLTVSLARDQREALEVIARENRVTLAFVVRYALDEFLSKHSDEQLRLRFPRA